MPERQAGDRRSGVLDGFPPTYSIWHQQIMKTFRFFLVLPPQLNWYVKFNQLFKGALMTWAISIPLILFPSSLNHAEPPSNSQWYGTQIIEIPIRFPMDTDVY